MSASQGLYLLGVGGGGCQYAAAARRLYGEGLQALGFDTDQGALDNIAELQTILLGGPRLDGLGTGGDLVKGRMAMQDTTEVIQQKLEGCRMAVVVTTLGGGTGGGATPELLRTLRKMDVATLCFALLPFSFEPATSRNLAERALPQLDENADTVVVIQQDALWQQAEAASVPLPTAQQQACALLGAGLTMVWQLLFSPGFIRFDQTRLHRLVSSKGRARFHISQAQGDNRAELAATQLLQQMATTDAKTPARAIMLGITSGNDLRLAEIDTIMKKTTATLPKKCNIDMGTVVNELETSKLSITALVFETWSDSSPEAQPATKEASPTRSGRSRVASRSSKLGYSTGRGRFRDIEPTIFNGEDLDIPTYVRKHIAL